MIMKRVHINTLSCNLCSILFVKGHCLMRHALSLLASLLVLCLLATPVTAQEATPEADLVTPDPEECQVEPRSMETLTGLIATPVADLATPEFQSATPVTVETFEPPEGEPADEETLAGVTATATELFACYNANDYLRVFALFTDEYLARSFAEEGVDEEALEFFGMPAEPKPSEEWESIALQDAQILEDGRVGAYLIGHNPEGDGADFVDYTIFVERDGRYLIDDVIFLTPRGE